MSKFNLKVAKFKNVKEVSFFQESLNWVKCQNSVSRLPIFRNYHFNATSSHFLLNFHVLCTYLLLKIKIKGNCRGNKVAWIMQAAQLLEFSLLHFRLENEFCIFSVLLVWNAIEIKALGCPSCRRGGFQYVRNQ